MGDAHAIRASVPRQIGFLRLWAAACTLLPAIGLLPHGDVGLVLLAVALSLEVVMALLAIRYTRGVLDGDRGELLFIAGGRVPLALVLLIQRLERVELGVATIGIAALLWLATPWTIAHGTLCLLLVFVVHRAQRIQWRSTRLQTLIQTHRFVEGLELSGRWRGGLYGNVLDSLHAALLLMNRRVEEGRRLRAEQWNGVVGRFAVAHAVDRLHTGDPELARKVLAELDGDDRYARYARSFVAGHLALVSGGDHRVEPGLLDDLPLTMAVELRLVDAALARRRGDEDLVARRLDTIDLEQESWRGVAFPAVWSALGRAAPAAVSSPAPAAAHVFEAPREEIRPVRRARFNVGAEPFPDVLLTSRLRARGTRGKAAILLVSAGALLVAASILLSTVSDEAPLPMLTEFALMAILTGIWSGGHHYLHRRLIDAERALVLADGRRLDLSRPGAIRLYLVSPVVMGLVALPLLVWALVSAAALLRLAVFSVDVVLASATVAVALFVPLAVFTTRQRWQALSLVLAVHQGDDDTLTRVTRRVPQQARPWGVLAHYLRGDAAAARALAVDTVLHREAVARVLRWDAAASGNLGLVDLLATRPRDDERFLHEVAVRLAALHERAPHQVLDRIDEALYLPNRIGDALRVLDHAILTQIEPQRAARLATTYAPELRQGAWIRRCWPDLSWTEAPTPPS